MRLVRQKDRWTASSHKAAANGHGAFVALYAWIKKNLIDRSVLHRSFWTRSGLLGGCLWTVQHGTRSLWIDVDQQDFIYESAQCNTKGFIITRIRALLFYVMELWYCYQPRPPYCLLIVSPQERAMASMLRPIISQITTAIRSRTSTSP